jgi:predicted Zn-dependent protease
MKRNLFGIIFLTVLLFAGVSSVHSQGIWNRIKKEAGTAAKEVVPDTRGVVSDTVKSEEGIAALAVATIEDVKEVSESLTPENEYYLGRAVAAQIAARYPISPDANLQNYLGNILNTIVINAPSRKNFKPPYKGYHVAILDADEINAFATPGGHIFVTRGLIACASSEDALASVIAHEVAHVQLRHAMTGIRNARYTNVFLGRAAEAAGDGIRELAGILGDTVNDLITTLIINGYSREQELEADAAALSLLAAAGYQPSNIKEMLTALNQKQQNDQGFGKTHPSPAERLAAVDKNLGNYAVADTASFRAGRFGDIVSR